MGKTIRTYEDEEDERDYEAIKNSRRNRAEALNKKQVVIASVKSAKIGYDPRLDEI